MRDIRLHARIDTVPVQPNEVDNTIEDSALPSGIEYIDADGCPVYGV